MPTGDYEEPLRAYHFRVEVRDLAVAHFVSCTGIEARVQHVAYRSGGEGMVVHQLPTMVEYTPCLLRWGVTRSTELWEWMRASLSGRVVRREVSVVMLDPDGIGERQRLNLLETWPCAWRASALDSHGREVAIESLALAYEQIERA